MRNEPLAVDAAAAYVARIDAVEEYRRRVGVVRREGDSWTRHAGRFVMDPRRPLDANLAVLAEYIRPDDVVVDVGGGAGRIGLPMALRCREVINVEPSPSMCAAFERTAGEAGIANARCVQAAWPVEGVEGDVTLVFNVTYFVREIVPFGEALVRASRRRVIIGVWSVPPPAQDQPLFELILGEPRPAEPSYRELLAVLWEMGIEPDVRVLPDTFRQGGGPPQTREETVARALSRLDMDDEATRGKLEENFHRLFERSAEGFAPLWRPDAREMLITWEI